MNQISKKEIYEALDDLRINTFFLNLEHGYFYTAGSRITIFADEKRWAIVFEKSGFNNPGAGCGIELSYYGNCLANLDTFNDEPYNIKIIPLIDSDEVEKIESNSSKQGQIIIRGTALKYDPDFITNEFREPHNLIPKPPNMEDIFRFLDTNYTSLFRATDPELKQCLSQDLPKLLVINEWFHITYGIMDGPAPSEIETFQQIAEVIATGDIANWKPTLKPNNHWKNWPFAGGL